MAELSAMCFSYIGERPNNEDACFALDFGNQIRLFAVADGMGGGNAGEIASQIALDTLKEHISEIVKKGLPEKDFLSGMKTFLKQACLIIQTDLADSMENNPGLNGMGTTLVAVLMSKKYIVVANIGDSRCYLISANRLVRITEDHSYIQEFRNTNGNEIPESMISSYGHLITRSLNGRRDEPDLFPPDKVSLELHEGEGLLLCSDGSIPATALIHPDGLQESIQTSGSLSEAGKNMISWAEKNGSKDNISLVLVK